MKFSWSRKLVLCMGVIVVVSPISAVMSCGGDKNTRWGDNIYQKNGVSYQIVNENELVYVFDYGSTIDFGMLFNKTNNMWMTANSTEALDNVKQELSKKGVSFKGVLHRVGVITYKGSSISTISSGVWNVAHDMWEQSFMLAGFSSNDSTLLTQNVW